MATQKQMSEYKDFFAKNPELVQAINADGKTLEDVVLEMEASRKNALRNPSLGYVARQTGIALAALVLGPKVATMIGLKPIIVGGVIGGASYFAGKKFFPDQTATVVNSAKSAVGSSFKAAADFVFKPNKLKAQKAVKAKYTLGTPAL